MSKPLSADRRNMILSGNLIQAILMLAIPVMINSFIQSMYNLTDTFWLGRIGTESQAAIKVLESCVPVTRLTLAIRYVYV